jgi:hypothetical protein
VKSKADLTEQKLKKLSRGRGHGHIPGERWASTDRAMFMIYDDGDVDSF